MWSRPLVNKDYIGPSGRYTEAQRAGAFLAYFLEPARNSQELIDSTTGVVLAPKVQPGPYQVKELSMGRMFLPSFATPSRSQVPILQL